MSKQKKIPQTKASQDLVSVIFFSGGEDAMWYRKIISICLGFCPARKQPHFIFGLRKDLDPDNTKNSIQTAKIWLKLV